MSLLRWWPGGDGEPEEELPLSAGVGITDVSVAHQQDATYAAYHII